MTYREAVLIGTDELMAAGIEDPSFEARELLCETASCDLTDYAARLSECLPGDIREVYQARLRRRAAHEPIQRITGHAWFMGMPFTVNEETLIPRDDSETLVLKAAEELRARKKPLEEIRVLDIGTGTGCLILSLLKMVPGIEAVGTDISEKALDAASQNAEANGLAAKFRKSDLFSNVSGVYDIIISNPPYIKTSDIDGLKEEVRAYDPYRALDGGEDGLVFYRRLIPASLAFLKYGGSLMLEIGTDQAGDVSDLMRRAGFSGVAVTKDLAGHDRVVSGRK